MKSGTLIQQANAILCLVLQNMQEERTKYLNAVQAIKNWIVEAIT